MTERLVWIWGRHPVLEAIRAGNARAVLVAAGRRPAPVLQAIHSAATEHGIAVREVPLPEIERLAPGQTTQGVAAQIVEHRVSAFGELLQTLESAPGPPFLLALDQIQDPQNLGSLLRTADAAGVQGVVVPERRSAAIAGAVAKASAGAISRIPLVEVINLTRALDELREAGVWVVGLDHEAQQDLYGTDFTVPVTLVVGSESQGLRRLTKQHCDFLVRLPMLGSIGSLNAAVAGAVAMYEVVRQRMKVPRSQS